MHEALPKARPVLLEPILAVEIAIPTEAMSRATAIVSGRRGQILGFDARPGWDGWDVLQALIPEGEMGDLIVELRSATSGVGTYTATFDHLAEIVGKQADAIVAQAAHARAQRALRVGWRASSPRVGRRRRDHERGQTKKAGRGPPFHS